MSSSDARAQSSGSSAVARPERETWSGRRVFILAAIGSAVGLGNIWRFPYVSYENGGGAFLIPYLIALVTAGIPLLFLDYAIGHKYRGSAPLAFRRLHRRAESLGWWQVAICFVIAVYYAVIIAWAVRYAAFSFSKAWGDDPAAFFTGEFLQVSEEVTVGFQFVPGILIPLAVVWILTIAVLSMGVQKGIARASVIFLPLLMLMFLVLVVQALLLPGSGLGLNALFTPDWSSLTNSTVWIAAYGQIFFSLSIAFGIMVTYSSYLKRKTDLTGCGLVAGFANSGFEILAGIGVFAALGFMAQSAGIGVDEVAVGGIGLAFIAFPAIISQAPAGSLLGVLFFGSLVFAGFTSLISIVQVVIAAVQDKMSWSQAKTALIVGVPMAVISLALFPTTTGLNLLDVTDAFVNNFGILGVAFVTVVVLSWGIRVLPRLNDHLNVTSSFLVGRAWRVMVGIIAPVVLGFTLITELIKRVQEGYGDMPTWFVGVFGWGTAAAMALVGVALAQIPWSPTSAADDVSAPGELESALEVKP